jgi:hypothetical protein
MGVFETVEPQKFRFGERVGVEFLGTACGCRRFALAYSSKDVLDGVALSGAGIVGISRSCAA